MKTLFLGLSLTFALCFPAIAEDPIATEVSPAPAGHEIEHAVTEEIKEEVRIDLDKSDAEEVREVIHEVVAELKGEWKNLPEEEKEKLRETLESIGDGITIDMNHDTDFGGVLIAVIAIMFTIGSPVLIVTAILIYAYRKRKQRDALISKFVDAGKDVPEEILSSFDRSSSSANNLQRGIMLCGIGIGLILFLGVLADWSVAAVGFIPLFIGLARLLIWKLDTKPASRELTE